MSDPLTNEVMCLLGDLWCGCLSGANGPNGLISYNDLGPVFDAVLECVKLNLKNVLCVSRFALFKVFTDADYSVHSLLLTPGYLLCYDLISLFELVASLAVTNDCPVHAEILDLLRLDLSSLSALVCSCDILHTHLNVRE